MAGAAQGLEPVWDDYDGHYPLTYDFGFAFNSKDFSDGILRIEIAVDDDYERTFNLPETRHRLYRPLLPPAGLGEGLANQGVDTEEEKAESFDESLPVGVNGSSAHIAATDIFDSSSSGQSATSVSSSSSSAEDNVETIETALPKKLKRVRDFWISSAVLGAHSKYFLKMFTSGLKESSEKCCTIKISEQEEDLLMDVLYFLYTGKLKLTEPRALLDILSIADFLEVVPLITHGMQLLTGLDMTVESALLYLDYPYTPTLIEKVVYLTELAQRFLTSRYKYLNPFPDELLRMPLVGLQVIFSSSLINVQSEDAIYDFLIEWSFKHYPNQKERRDVWSSNLLPLIRFCHMSKIKLRQISADRLNGFHRKDTLQCVSDALTGTVELAERKYGWKPIKVVEFDRPFIQSTVYLSLTRDECALLSPVGELRSCPFSFAGRRLCLIVSCERNHASNSNSFGFWVGKCGKQDLDVTVSIEFASKRRASRRYETIKEIDNVVFSGEEIYGGLDMFDRWPVFISDDNLFIDDVISLKVEVTLVA